MGLFLLDSSFGTGLFGPEWASAALGYPFHSYLGKIYE